MRDKRFLPYEPDKALELPSDMRTWLPENHLAFFISDVVDELDLSEIVDKYQHPDGGHPAYHPAMMVKLLFYAYAVGIRSSRRIEQKTYEDVAFRVLSCDSHPDHSRISDFRKRHLHEISGLFVQILKFCSEAGLTKLGHVALDGSKIKANASKHKAMSYGRMVTKETELEVEIERLLVEAQAVDAAEDLRYGKGKRGDELPEDLKFKQARLKKIREYKKALEQRKRQEAIDSGKLDKDGNPPASTGGTGKVPKAPPGIPKPKDQINFTDPESRIMLDGATKAWVQAYNSQIAVDCESQIIVAADVTQQANDKQQLIPITEQVMANTGKAPEAELADAGYFSESNVGFAALNGIEPLIPKDRTKHTDAAPPLPNTSIGNDTPEVARMLAKLKTKEGKKIYSKRKESVEAVFGQIKEARGIRGFLLRGLEQARGEWRLICLTHNILKLWKNLSDTNRIGAPFCGKKAKHSLQFLVSTMRFPHVWAFRATVSLCMAPSGIPGGMVLPSPRLN